MISYDLQPLWYKCRLSLLMLTLEYLDSGAFGRGVLERGCISRCFRLTDVVQRTPFSGGASLTCKAYIVQHATSVCDQVTNVSKSEYSWIMRRGGGDTAVVHASFFECLHGQGSLETMYYTYLSALLILQCNNIDIVY